MLLEHLVGHKIQKIYRDGDNLLVIKFEDPYRLEIYAILDDGTLAIDLVQVKLVEEVVKRESL